MTTWREWELSAEWTDEAICPDCGHALIITNIVENTNLYNGICPDCRRQYTVTHEEPLNVDDMALSQQERIDTLEARVARLEAIVQELMTRPTVPTRPPIPQGEREVPQGEQDATIRSRYKFLF